MSENATGTSQGPEWLPLEERERIVWYGGPRYTSALPGIVTGLIIVGVAAILGGLGAGIGTGILRQFAPGAVLRIPSVAFYGAAVVIGLYGLFVLLGAYFRVRNTYYVVTTNGVYWRRGGISQDVAAAGYETIQNVSYSQGILGRLFDWGELSFDTAGGADVEVAFTYVDDPRGVQETVEEYLSKVRHRGTVGDRSDADAFPLPGTPEQWDEILTELRAVRRAFEER